MVKAYNIELEENFTQINKKISNILKVELDKSFQRSFIKSKQIILDIVKNAIIRSPEYNSILNGTLKYEFGLPDSADRLNTILKFWTKINADYSKPKLIGNKLYGGFSIYMIDSTYSDVLASSAASFVTEKNSTLNWLEWLLLFGNKTIIKDYVVQFGYNPNSRTGKAIMKGVARGKWSVPSEFAGTAGNNWITRAIDSVDIQINNVIISILKDNLNV